MQALLERNWLASPISKPELLNIALAERMALEVMRQGIAQRVDWVTLRDTAAMAETMAFGGVGPEALTDASAALDVLYKAHDLSGPLTAPEVKTVGEMLAYHAEQRRLISRSEVLVWVKKTVEKFNVPVR